MSRITPPAGDDRPWVHIKTYLGMQKGETAEAVRKRVRSGKWLSGVHVRQPDGSKYLWVNLDAVNDWAEGKLPPHLHGKQSPRASRA